MVSQLDFRSLCCCLKIRQLCSFQMIHRRCPEKICHTLLRMGLLKGGLCLVVQGLMDAISVSFRLSKDHGFFVPNTVGHLLAQISSLQLS
jgi:hypothetical protein